MLICISKVMGIFICDDIFTGQNIACHISQSQLNSICEISCAIVPICAVSSSQHIAAVFIYGHSIRSGFSSNDVHCIADTINFNVDRKISLVIHGESEIKFTHIISVNSNFRSTVCELQIKWIARNDLYFLLFWSFICCSCI